MSGQQTILTEHQQQAMQSVGLARLAITEALPTHPFANQVMHMCEESGLVFDDACIILAGHLIKQVNDLMAQVIEAHSLQVRPYIMVCSEAERDAMLTLLHVKAL